MEGPFLRCLTLDSCSVVCRVQVPRVLLPGELEISRLVGDASKVHFCFKSPLSVTFQALSLPRLPFALISSAAFSSTEVKSIQIYPSTQSSQSFPLRRTTSVFLALLLHQSRLSSILRALHGWLVGASALSNRFSLPPGDFIAFFFLISQFSHQFSYFLPQNPFLSPFPKILL